MSKVAQSALSVVVEPHCSRAKELVPDSEILGQLTSFRGVPARQRGSTHMTVWTGDVTISVMLADSSKRSVADVATSALRSMSADASNSVAELPAPDLSPCQ